MIERQVVKTQDGLIDFSDNGILSLACLGKFAITEITPKQAEDLAIILTNWVNRQRKLSNETRSQVSL